ncbi:MAG TPA: hypothetical protein VLX60_08460 [Terriglobales bacterium]|nr:hypothetical protein [Terriglobales bacterium]
MRKLPEVVEAKELMAEAVDWSTFTWMFQKSKVRETADVANTALDKMTKHVKSRWTEELRAAYKEASAKAEKASGRTPKGKTAAKSAEDIDALIEKVKAADAAAHRARKDAEDTFALAERQLNLDLAREGCKKAIHSWELHEKAIRLAEELLEATASQS